jgi:hypothetical protein
MMPGEAVSFYATAVASVMQLHDKRVFADFFWVLVGVTVLPVILLVVIRWRTTKDAVTNQAQWEAVGISAISFLIYAYTMGGPFRFFPAVVGLGWQGAIGFIMASFWTSITPFLFAAR